MLCFHSLALVAVRGIMLSLSKFLDSNKVFLEFEAQDKTDCLKKIVDIIISHSPNYRKDKNLLNRILSRESKASTGAENGFAIPHSSCEFNTKTEMFFFKSQKGIDFDSIDGKKSHFFFLILYPKNSTLYLQIIVKVCQLSRSQEIYQKFSSLESSEKLLELIG